MTSGLSDRELHQQQMSKMEVGHSFFLEGVLPSDCAYIRKLGYKLGFRLSIRYVAVDEIFGKHGTRVKRIG